MTARLHCPYLLSWLVLLLLLGGTRPALASHLLGGELTHKYLDATGPATAPYRYEITASVYVTCSSSATTSYLNIDFYNKATGAHYPITSPNVGSANGSDYGGGLELTQSSIGPCTTLAVPPGCTITGAAQPYQLQKFIGTVCLPASAAGFYAVTTPSGNRNAGISNIGNGFSSSYYLGLYATLLPASIPNRAPVFTGEAVGLICAGDTTVIVNNAVDPDGDRLVYAFGQPYNANTLSTFTAPLPYVPYTTAGGYSAAAPLGTGAGYYAKINASTGVTKYVGGPTVGNRYSTTVDVTEYRTLNGVEVALGTTRRDMQLLVGNCPAVAAPTLPAVASMPRSYTIEAGSTLSIPVAGSQAAAHPLTLTATSALLDGSAGYSATFGGNTGTPTYAGSPVGAYTVAGTVGGTVAGTFVFTPTCTQARATPYEVILALRDVGCAGKLTSDVLRITVTPPTGPTNVTGNLAVCGLGTTQTYTATGGTAPQVHWTVTGGTIVGSPTANPVAVRWPTAGTGTIKAQGLTQYGCLADVATKTVRVSPATVLTATGNLTICPGGSTTLTVTGGPGPFLLTGGPAPVSGPGPFVLSPTQTTTYSLSTVVLPASGCPPAGQVTVVVTPAPVATAGAAASFCSGGTAQLGAAPVSGATYSWSPATGLSSNTVANPTVTLTNTTGAPITQTYTLTMTSGAGCTSTTTVAVTVNPLPVAAAGTAVAICSGGNAQLGAAAVSGLTYSWSPATGLSSNTVANPTLSLTNPTGSLRFELYTLTVTNAGGCTTTSPVRVTVLPAVVPGTIGSDQTVCAGAGPAPLTSMAAAAGGAGTYAYQWESSPDNLTWTAVAGATSPTYTPGPMAATTYFRRRVVAGTCDAVYSNVVAVTAQPLLLPAVALPVLPAQCAGTAFTFTPMPTNAGNNPTYQWFVNGTAVGAGPSYTSTALRDGDVVRVVLTPTVGFCASGLAIATARVSRTPVLISSVKISTSTALPVCVGAPIAFGIDVVANIGSSPQYQWQVDGVRVAGATGPRFSSSTLRDGQAVTLVVRSTDACGQPATAASNAVRVSTSQPVQLSAGPDKTITEGETVVLAGTADGSYPVVWSPAQTLTFATGNQLRPVAAPLVTTTYALSAGAGYCGGTSLVTVTVLPRVRIPNAFSPNGDNNDDTWQIDNIEAYPNSRVLVFNRWGAKVFEATNYARGSEWNGTTNGQPVPFGTYYYVITLGNGKSFTGPITIIN